jgi:tetratricopeptide (TPR) repeat protein
MPSYTPLVGQLLGHYRILEQIGAGGMGIVYRAHDERLQRDVAIKILPPGSLADEAVRKRFRKEALALAKLNHPNIATAFDFCDDGDIHFLVTEYIPGITLNVKLAGGPLPQTTVIDLGIQLARGLEAAHREGVVHRDLKPGNLRLHQDEQLKILDFGLAQFSPQKDHLAETASCEESRLIVGTLPYMAPEQLRGTGADPRTDIWAAGAVLYEMATGQRAFVETQTPPLIEAILHRAPTPPRALNGEMSHGLETVILKALDKDPERRYQSARELRVDLVRLLPSGEVPASMLETSGAGRMHTRPTRRAVVLLAAVLAAGIVAGFLMRGRVWKSKELRQRVLAVLPFDAVGHDAETSAFGIGLTETLTAKLAELSDSDSLQLVSTREIQGQGVKTAEAARREFGTDLVLEGNVQQFGQIIRVNCSLVDSKTHRQISARTITTAAHNIFDLEDQVVAGALEILSIEIQPEKRRNLNTHPDTKPAAYEAYLRGRGYLQEYQKAENIDSAISEFDHALQIDPNYALAYAALGEAYWRGFQQTNRANDWVTKAATNCEKALSVTPELAEAHTCLGDVYNGTGRYAEAVQQFQRAVELDRNSQGALRGLADAYENLGNKSAAEDTYRRAVTLHPQYWGSYSSLGAFYYRNGRYVDAAQMFRRVIDLSPDNYRGYSNLGGIYVIQGRYSESIETLKKSIELRPNLDAYPNLGYAYFMLRRFTDSAETFQQGLKLDDQDWLLWGNLGDALYWTPGRRRDASRPYHKAISLARSKLEVNPQDATTLAYLAGYYAMVGEKNSALENLRRAVALAPSDPDIGLRAAIIYNHFDDISECLASLRKALEAGLSPSMIRDTPDFDHLQQNLDFAKLVKNKQ